MAFWIIGHWYSCNLGDRCQPYTILDSLFLRHENGTEQVPPNVYMVNLFSGGDTAMSTTIAGKTYPVFGPNDSKLPPAQNAVMTTGSLYSNSSYMVWVKEFIQNQRIKSLVIWGGFGIGGNTVETFSKALSILKSPQIAYYARSAQDLELYRQIVGNAKRGRLAGDPLMYWTNSKTIKRGLELYETLVTPVATGEKIVNFKGLVVVPSLYAFNFNYSFWHWICCQADAVICVDSAIENEIIQRYRGKSVVIRDAWRFCDAIKGSRHVVSGRLHGAVLSAGMGIPTTLLVTDDANPRQGSFKFDAVGSTAVDLKNGAICEVIKVCQAQSHLMSHQIPQLYTDNVKRYMKLTTDSLAQIKSETLND